jgi:hypothetical protein
MYASSIQRLVRFGFCPILGVIELRPNFGKLNDVAVAADFCKRTFAQKV